MQTAYDQNHVVRHRLNTFHCWVAGDSSRCWNFEAVSKDEADKLAAKRFGVSELRIMSREVR